MRYQEMVYKQHLAITLILLLAYHVSLEMDSEPHGGQTIHGHNNGGHFSDTCTCYRVPLSISILKSH